MRLIYLLYLAISPQSLTADTIIVKTKAPQNRNAVLWLTAALLLVNGALWAADSSGTDKVLAEIEYFYADDGTLTGKAINGQRMNFEYDLRGQLLAVKDAQGKDLERYTYDPAGNRLSKAISGITTTYTYDKANQLVSSTVEDFTTYYKYDSAGRMIQAGDKTYRYNGQNKVVEVKENGKVTARFDYYMDGQLAQADYADKQETFLWDGLSLIQRNDVNYVNEPYITGGNPIMANNDVMLNDMLGSTVAINNKTVEMTSFGETDAMQAMYTGKPQVNELGYTFPFRNYNPNQGKWTTVDPLGYPDGWNNLAYCNNSSTIAIDQFGTDVYHLVDTEGAFADAGHSVYIIGNPQDGYTAYDYQANGSSGSGSSGSNSNSESRVQGGFVTPEDALAFLNSNRSPEHNFDKGQTWETSPEEDAAARLAAAQYMLEDYSLLAHNCYDLEPDAIFDAINKLRDPAKQIDVSDGPHPNKAFDYNNNHGAKKIVME